MGFNSGFKGLKIKTNTEDNFRSDIIKNWVVEIGIN